MAKILRYKDMNCASGTSLHKALEDGDQKLTEKIYKEYNEAFHQMFPRELWTKIKEMT
jgi:hypothetical protein